MSLVDRADEGGARARRHRGGACRSSGSPTTRRCCATAPTAPTAGIGRRDPRPRPTCSRAPSSRSSPARSARAAWCAASRRAAASSRASASTSSPSAPSRSARRGSCGRWSEDGGWRSPIAKFLSDEEIAAATAQLGRHRGRRDPDRGRHAPRSPRACSATCASRWPTSRRGPRPLLGRRLPDVRVERGRAAAGTRCTTRSPRRRATSTPTPAPGAAAPTTWCWTAGSSAAARSASTAPSVQQKVFDAIGIDARGGAGALRLPARGARLRRAAARRHRVRHRPHRRRCWRAPTRSAT